MNKSKPVIGLCGGIGAGKSLVAAEFGRLGAVVIASDQLNREVLARPDVAGRLREWWGDAVLDATGSVDRAAVARIVFEDAAARKRLESLTHPLIDELRSAIMQQAVADSAVRAIILDSPLLFESRLDRRCDAVVFVDSPEDQRLARLRRDRGWDVQEVRSREKWQLPLEEKRRRSDYVVRNEGAPADLQSQAAAVLERIVSEHPAPKHVRTT
jgi:dephospho-CoA kinase